MTFVVGASAHGSPGVSTALQLVAAQWEGEDTVPVVVEADASGGVLAARYDRSLSPGFVSLAESLRKFETPPLLDHAQRLPSGVACVSLSPSATAASAQLRSAGAYLGPYLAESGHPVLLDAGTVVPDSKVVASLGAADLMLWFVRPTREELLVLRHRLAECSQPENVGIVLVGDTPYRADQVVEALGVPVLHTLPIDQRGASAANLGGDDRFLRRSVLARSCSQLASEIQTQVAARPRSRSAGVDHAGSPPQPSAEQASEQASAPAVAVEAAQPAASPAVATDVATQVHVESASSSPAAPAPVVAEELPPLDDQLAADEVEVWTHVEDEATESGDPTLVVWVNDDQD